jgi:MFS family permease
VSDLRRPLVLVATSVAAFTATLDNTVVAVALRDLQADLGAGVAELQGVVTAYTVALAALLLTGGTLADVAGRRRVFVGGLAVFAAASAACALADSATALIAARAVQGAGAALVLPGGLAVLAAAYPEPGPRARAVGLWAATSAAALVLGPVVGGVLVAASGWPAVFWVNVPLCVVVAVVVLLVAPSSAVASPQPAGALLVTGPLRRGHRVPASRRLSRRDGQTPWQVSGPAGQSPGPSTAVPPARPAAEQTGQSPRPAPPMPLAPPVAEQTGQSPRPAPPMPPAPPVADQTGQSPSPATPVPPGGRDTPPPPARRGLDLPGQLLGAVALAAATYAVVLAGRDGLGTPVAVAAVVALAAAMGFFLVERRTADPVLPLELLRSRAFLGATLGAFAASLAVFVLLVFVSLFLQLVQQREALPAALRLLPLTLALVVTAPVAGRWAGARGPRAPVVAGLLVTALGLGLTGWRLDPAMPDLELAVLLAVSGLGIGLTTAPVVTASLDAVARSRSGLAAATVNVARELGGVVAVAGLGALVVARLSRDLTGQLLGLRCPPAARTCSSRRCCGGRTIPR